VTKTDQGYAAWIDHDVVDSVGDKVSEIYIDDHTGQPEWVPVNTGAVKSRPSFAPLQGARADGDQTVFAYDKAKVKDAPQVEDDGDGYLTPEEERGRYRYYGPEYDTSQAPQGVQVRGEGRETSGPNTDDAMTRSEKRSCMSGRPLGRPDAPGCGSTS
jgi:hypothetical protein